MDNFIDYIKDLFGTTLEVNAANREETTALPIYITEAYEFWQGRYANHHIVFAEKKAPELFTPAQFKKQKDILEQCFKQTIVFVLPTMEAYNRNRLIQQRVNFVLPYKQFFAPDLFIDLKEENIPQKRQGQLQPAAQCLILYHLQFNSLNGLNYKQIADAIHYPYLTISRAVENIKALGLCHTEGSKDKRIAFDAGGNQLWEKAMPYLRNPIVGKRFTDELLPEYFVCRSNVNALAHYTDINDEPQEYFSIHQDLMRKLMREGQIKLNEWEGRYCIESYLYPPETVAIDGFIDRLSLYLSFADNQDERIQMALNQLPEQLW